MHLYTAIWRYVFALWLAGAAITSAADEPGKPVVDNRRPAIALIIDDMGNQHAQGLRVIDLPGPVACAFLPYGAFTGLLARRAHARNKEVMLHLPMQSVAPDVEDRGELTLDMTGDATVRAILIADTNRVEQLFINEIMASNVDGLADESGESAVERFRRLTSESSFPEEDQNPDETLGLHQRRGGLQRHCRGSLSGGGLRQAHEGAGL